MISRFKNDFHENPTRFLCEVICLILNAIAAGTLAITAHEPNMLMIYSVWVVASIFGMVSGYMRSSFGIVSLNIMFLVFDFVGIAQIIKAQGI